MKIIVPNYYKEFRCIADRCKHTCCRGWEVEIDEESMERFSNHADILERVDQGEDTHFRLLEGEICPFLMDNGLCEMIVKYGEKMLCQTCTDHPRFRNYWTDRVEMGLGLVCEEAARLILNKEMPMRLEVLSDDLEPAEELPEDEQWLLDVRDSLLENISEEGPLARLKEYLIYRHIPDALYDDRLEERIRFVDLFVRMAQEKWDKTDRSIEALEEIVRTMSYDMEYDEEVKENYLENFSKQ